MATKRTLGQRTSRREDRSSAACACPSPLWGCVDARRRPAAPRRRAHRWSAATILFAAVLLGSAHTTRRGSVSVPVLSKHMVSTRPSASMVVRGERTSAPRAVRLVAAKAGRGWPPTQTPGPRPPRWRRRRPLAAATPGAATPELSPRRRRQRHGQLCWSACAAGPDRRAPDIGDRRDRAMCGADSVATTIARACPATRWCCPQTACWPGRGR